MEAGLGTSMKDDSHMVPRMRKDGVELIDLTDGDIPRVSTRG